MDENSKKLADSLIKSLKTNPAVNKRLNELLDLEAKGIFASLVIEVVDSTDKSLDIKEETKKMYREVYDYLSSKGYRSDLLFLVLSELKYSILGSNKELNEMAEYIKHNTLD